MRKNRTVELAGVNHVRALIEQAGHIFQPVNLENDIGKDAYVDILDEDGAYQASMAVQIKSGASFRRKNGYAITASTQHRHLWGASAMPVIGIIYDGDRGKLVWCDLSAAVQTAAAGTIAVSKVLDLKTLKTELIPYVRRRQHASSLALYSDDEATQVAAVWDHFAIGRGDGRAFLLLRDACRSLHGNGLRAALFALGHLTLHHPDIWWRDDNIIPEKTLSQVRRHIHWPEEHLAHFLNELTIEEFSRGESGLDLLLLLAMDYDGGDKIFRIAAGKVAQTTAHAQEMALFVILDYVSRENGEPLRLFNDVVAGNPVLASQQSIAEIHAHLLMHGCLFLVD